MSEEKNMTETSSEEKKKSKKSVIILEIILALAAVAGIGFAIYNAKAPKEPANTTASTDVLAFNTSTEAECEELAKEGKMIKLTNKDGSYAYVQNYTDLDYLKSNVSVTDEEIDQLLFAQVGSKHSVDAPADKTVCELYDTVDIDYVGKKDGVAFDGGTGNHPGLALGSGSFIPGFEEGVVGMAVGETKDLNLKFPDQYHSAELAGQEVVFTVTLNKIVSVPAEITDEMVAEVFGDAGVTTIDGCKEYLKSYALEEKLTSFINSKSFVSAVSDESINSHYEATMKYYEQMSTYYQKTVEEMIVQSGSDMESFTKEVMDNAKASAVNAKLYSTIAENNSLKYTEEELKKLATDYGCATVDELYETYSEVVIHEYLTAQKVLEFIIEKVK